MPVVLPACDVLERRGTLSAFKNITCREDYRGNLDRMVRCINQWMETIARRGELKSDRRANAQMPEGWVETDIAKRILVVVEKTISLCCISLVTGDAGRGKTLTLRAAEQLHPGSVLIRVNRTSRTPASLLKHIAEHCGIPRSKSTDSRALESRLIGRLKGTGRALLIDEAHQLKPEAFELIRDLHDECGLPIVLAGTIRVAEIVSDENMFYGQLTSRIGLRYDITEATRDPGGGGNGPRPLHTVDEIKALFHSDKVRLTDDAAVFLSRIANVPGLGGLRLCAKLVQVAASAASGEPIGAKLILQVVRMLYGREYAQQAVERPIERSKLRIA